jgi:hypothetical protein
MHEISSVRDNKHTFWLQEIIFVQAHMNIPTFFDSLTKEEFSDRVKGVATKSQPHLCRPL